MFVSNVRTFHFFLYYCVLLYNFHIKYIVKKPHMPPRRCASQTGPAFSLGCSPGQSSQTLARIATQPYVTLVYRFNPCKTYNTTHLPNRWSEGWVGQVGWSIADSLPTKWSYVNHRSGMHRSGKVRRQKTGVLPTALCGAKPKRNHVTASKCIHQFNQ